MNSATDLARPHDQIRPVEIECGYLESTPASVLYKSGKTIVLCTASVETSVPPWMEGRGKGWVTAEYNMLPGSTSPRKRRDRSGKVDGRTTEIQRLIGRSLRAIVDLHALGERSITVDCDVLQADGGTRTASITGGYIALSLAISQLAAIPELDPPVDPTAVLRDSVAAISVGVIGEDVVLDLDYRLDSAADVDMNVIMTGSGRFIELQGTGEEATFDDVQLAELLRLGKIGIADLTKLQKAQLAAVQSPPTGLSCRVRTASTRITSLRYPSRLRSPAVQTRGSPSFLSRRQIDRVPSSLLIARSVYVFESQHTHACRHLGRRIHGLDSQARLPTQRDRGVGRFC